MKKISKDVRNILITFFIPIILIGSLALLAYVIDLNSKVSNFATTVESSQRYNNTLKEQLEKQIAEVERLNKIESQNSKEKIEEWLVNCNKDYKRSIVRVHAFHYDTFLGIDKVPDSPSYSISGVIIKTNTSKVYLLTSYDITKTDKNTSKYVVYDGFTEDPVDPGLFQTAEETGYVCKLEYRSKKYNLALLSFSSPNNEIYRMELADKKLAYNDLVCNLYAFEEGYRNYMNLSKITGIYKDEDDEFNVYFNETVKKGTPWGGATINTDGKLAGIIIYYYPDLSGVSCVNVEIIKAFLDDAKISYN